MYGDQSTLFLLATHLPKARPAGSPSATVDQATGKELVRDRLANISGLGPLVSSGFRSIINSGAGGAAFGTPKATRTFSGSWSTALMPAMPGHKAPYGDGLLPYGSGEWQRAGYPISLR